MFEARRVGGSGQYVVDGDAMHSDFIGPCFGPVGNCPANGVADPEVGQRLLHAGADDVDDVLLYHVIDGVDGDGLQGAALGLLDQLGDSTAVVLGGLPDPSDQGKVILVAAFGKAVIAQGQQAGKFIGSIAKLCGGGGGGRPNLAQAGGRDGAALNGALEAASDDLKHHLG